MEYVTGVSIALLVSLAARFIGFDKDRAFYPTVLAVIASYYVLFAAMSGAMRTIITESAVMAVFFAASVLGFKRNLWFIVAALLAHGIFDFTHGQLIVNTGVPVWWPMFCLAYDFTAAGYLAWQLMQRETL